MSIRKQIFGEVTVAADSTDVYTSQTITPAAISGGVITVTKADVGGDSGASLAIGKLYRLRIDADDYYDTILDNEDADEFFFRISATYGVPASNDITTITELTESVVDVSIDELTAKAINLKWEGLTDSMTVTNQSVVFADGTDGDLTLTLPKISDVGDGRLLIVVADVNGNNIILSPNAADQVAGGGADTDRTIAADATEIFIADAETAINDWKLVASI